MIEIVPTDRRLGKFYIGNVNANNSVDKIVAVLQGVAVLRCEFFWHEDRFEYIGFSDQFSPVPQGDALPIYEAILHTVVDDDGKVTYTRQWA